MIPLVWQQAASGTWHGYRSSNWRRSLCGVSWQDQEGETSPQPGDGYVCRRCRASADQLSQARDVAAGGRSAEVVEFLRVIREGLEESFGRDLLAWGDAAGIVGPAEDALSAALLEWELAGGHLGNINEAVWALRTAWLEAERRWIRLGRPGR